MAVNISGFDYSRWTGRVEISAADTNGVAGLAYVSNSQIGFESYFK
jgi:GH25 family lysozyme M1 (1,4-beta-N-acetylmuramidase)